MIKIIAVGTIKDKHLDALIKDYEKRINSYHKLQIIEVKDEPITSDERMVKEREGRRVYEKIGSDEYVILLDLHGQMTDSISLSNKIDKLFVHHSKLTFVIGGSLGLADCLVERSNERIKLSDLTFTHQMTRLILLEQIYRCFKIINHETYHK